jgi:hypothetical protein
MMMRRRKRKRELRLDGRSVPKARAKHCNKTL